MADVRHIQSRDNALLKRLRALSHTARERRREGRSVLDGVHLIEAALDAGHALEHVVLSEHALSQRECAVVLARLPAGTDVACVPDALFAPLSPVDTPSGIVALFAPPQAPEQARCEGDVLVLDGIQDPGNLGSILRTAAAAGLREVALTPGCAQAWSPRCLRAGMGGHFRLFIREQVDALALLEHYPGRVLATALSGSSVDLYELAFDGPVAWLFGSEGGGLSATLLERADTRVRIPMPGATESLNVGAAVAVCLFEQLRQRRTAD